MIYVIIGIIYLIIAVIVGMVSYRIDYEELLAMIIGTFWVIAVPVYIIYLIIFKPLYKLIDIIITKIENKRGPK